MGGAIVGCSRPDDGVRVADYLVAVGAASRQQVGAFASRLGGGEDLVDLLVLEAGVKADAVFGARRSLFEDNFFGMLVLPDPNVGWEPADMVFPPNLQIGIDPKSLLSQAQDWLAAVGPHLDALRSGSKEWMLDGKSPLPADEPDLGLLQDPHSMDDILDLLGLPRWKALGHVGALLSAGCLVAGTSRPVVPAPETGTGPDDYEKAARGHFVKSYDVLDKVDLSGTMDGGPHHEVATFGAIEAVEVGGEIDDDLADVESDEHMGFTGDFDAFSESDADGPDGDGIGELGDDALSQATDEDDDMVVDVESGDGLESIRSSDVLQSVVVDAGLDDDEDAAAQVEQSVSVTGELERVAGSAFSREELRAFHDRVDVFNAMFRIMWRTFARHLGAEATRQRFEQKIAGCLVGYPELFRDVQVADDGSVRATALVNNLTPQAATGGAQETLHQGLYELMFAHMFDAKEFLPPEAEATMMEQVVAFERQLHES